MDPTSPRFDHTGQTRRARLGAGAAHSVLARGEGLVFASRRAAPAASPAADREFFIDNLLVRIHVIIVMIRWTGLAPWEFEFPFAGSLTSTFLGITRRGEQP